VGRENARCHIISSNFLFTITGFFLKPVSFTAKQAIEHLVWNASIMAVHVGMYPSRYASCLRRERCPPQLCDWHRRASRSVNLLEGLPFLAEKTFFSIHCLFMSRLLGVPRTTGGPKILSKLRIRENHSAHIAARRRTRPGALRKVQLQCIQRMTQGVGNAAILEAVLPNHFPPRDGNGHIFPCPGSPGLPRKVQGQRRCQLWLAHVRR